MNVLWFSHYSETLYSLLPIIEKKKIKSKIELLDFKNSILIVRFRFIMTGNLLQKFIPISLFFLSTFALWMKNDERINCKKAIGIFKCGSRLKTVTYLYTFLTYTPYHVTRLIKIWITSKLFWVMFYPEKGKEIRLFDFDLCSIVSKLDCA
jgi:hypothetical protein